MSAEPTNSALPERKLHRFQFSLRTLLTLVTLAGCFCGWFAATMRQSQEKCAGVSARELSLFFGNEFRRPEFASALPGGSFARFAVKLQWAHEQREAVAELRKRGGYVLGDFEDDGHSVHTPYAAPSAPDWARNFLGDDYFGGVYEVNFITHEHLRDTDLESLRRMPSLKNLLLNDTPIGDAALEHVRGLTQLSELAIGLTRVTDAGMECLEGLSQLKLLDLRCQFVGDAGLKHLQGLIQLESLSLDDTQVTDAGLVYLKRMHKLRYLDISGTRITQVGLESLAELHELRQLSLYRTRVTGDGLRYLQGLTQLETLNLSQTRVHDFGLVYLKGLHQLRDLMLSETQVTSDGVKDLRAALPKCQIRY